MTMKLEKCRWCGSEGEHIHIYDGEEIAQCTNVMTCPGKAHFASSTPEAVVALWNASMSSTWEDCARHMAADVLRLSDRLRASRDELFSLTMEVHELRLACPKEQQTIADRRLKERGVYL